MANKNIIIREIKLLFFCIISCMVGVSCQTAPVDKILLSSPDFSIQMEIDPAEKQNSYSIFYNGDPIVKEGTWGIRLQNTLLYRNAPFQVKGPQGRTDTTGLRDGTVSLQQFNEYDLIFSDDQRIQLRMFNNAVAYRYVIQSENHWEIEEELSSWTIPPATKTWYFERENHWKLKSYAGEWQSCLAGQLDTISAIGPLQGIPLVFDFGSDVYGFLTEAALYNYSGMRLLAGKNGKLTANFTEDAGFAVDGRLVSPWRVFYIGKGLNQLVNQQVIAALNPKPDPAFFKNIDYIKPGRATWRWWSKGTGTPDQEKKVIGDAAELGFEYSLIDEGWERWEQAWEQVKKLTQYAKDKGVKVLLWKHSNELNKPENDYEIMKHWLDQVKAAGAAGVKVDFMNSEAKLMIDFDIRLLQEAAKRELLVVFHGCQQPSGESYTYPNELTREGIRGLELNKMKEGPIPARHNAALPFTRFVVGDGDYTPLGFSNPGNTTWTHQLATLVCFTSYLQVIAEDPSFLLTEQKVRPALEIIKAIPTDWDETIVLPGSTIGGLAAFARRKGDDWFIGVLATETRQLSIDFSFLHEGNYQSLIIEDHQTNQKNNDKFIVNHGEISSTMNKCFSLKENGGLLLYLQKD